MKQEPVTTADTGISAPQCRFDPKPKRDATLCHCRRVRESEVVSAIERGARQLEEVSARTGAGTGCRACHCRIHRMLMGLPARCGGRFDWCEQCGCASVVCSCAA